jgi:flagellar basal-body rod protein FlgB
MDGISDAALVAALRRQMTIAAAKQIAAASNLANVDTPQYKAVEPTFAEALANQVETVLSGGKPNLQVRLEEVEGLPARRDGNTVQIDRELLAMNRASGDFSKAQTALAAKFRLVRYAIEQGSK